MSVKKNGGEGVAKEEEGGKMAIKKKRKKKMPKKINVDEKQK